MKVFPRLFLCFVLPVMVIFPGKGLPDAAPKSVTFEQKCLDEAKKSGKCPEYCEVRCAPGQAGPQCEPRCQPRACFQIPAGSCPALYCELVPDCSGGKACYERRRDELPMCGDTGYPWPDAECCDGMVRRCGIDFIDGRCDMEGKNSTYAAPVCLPCGDGTCGQFENKCNCPEDCSPAYR
ncbi:MAG: hypothetical protein Q8Q08_01265 [Candidatus Omnitrophota bacterium]|nr:hypothetical protein [Candidatus Omnitrophota bacterium]MDZ4241670.1 hypothetical protein [Candidatus Omnitrophota bacterium]